MPKPDKPYLIVDFPDLENELPPRNCPGCGADIVRAHADYDELHARFENDPSQYALDNGHEYETLDQVYEIISKIIEEKPKKNLTLFRGPYCSATIEYGCTVRTYEPSTRYPNGQELRCGAIYWGEHMVEGGLWFTTSTFESGDYSCSHPSIENIERILAEMKENQ